MIHDIFVPGRLCLLGEHTDWATTYRSSNAEIAVGRCVVCTTNEGLYARVEATERSVIVFTHRDKCDGATTVEFDLDIDFLNKEARKGGFFSYVTGSAAAILESIRSTQQDSQPPKGGIIIDNHLTSLPMKKGLSSSAAVCVMVVKSFAAIWGLELSHESIMTIARDGERKTGSMCGIMDFCVVMGAGVALMTMAADGFFRLDVIHVAQPLFLVVADLRRSKDTRLILAALNACFPLATTESARSVHGYVAHSQDLCLDAVRAIEDGKCTMLAQAMSSAQRLFDDCMQVCPAQLTAPRLHEVMGNAALQRISLASKGIGSQGDGSVQVLCESAVKQREVLHLLDTELGCEPFVITIPASSAHHVDRKLSKRLVFSALVNVTSETKESTLLGVLTELRASGVRYVAVVAQTRGDFGSFHEEVYFQSRDNATNWLRKTENSEGAVLVIENPSSIMPDAVFDALIFGGIKDVGGLRLCNVCDLC